MNLDLYRYRKNSILIDFKPLSPEYIQHSLSHHRAKHLRTHNHAIDERHRVEMTPSSTRPQRHSIESILERMDENNNDFSLFLLLLLCWCCINSCTLGYELIDGYLIGVLELLEPHN